MEIKQAIGANSSVGNEQVQLNFLSSRRNNLAQDTVVHVQTGG
jgi:hypothetical protein